LKERIEKIIAAGANVILTTMGMDDVANKYLVEKGILGLRRVPKSDIRKIAKCTGATVVTTLATPEGDEVFESNLLG
jgi:T-complex protein 1 subunit alpha